MASASGQRTNSQGQQQARALTETILTIAKQSGHGDVQPQVAQSMAPDLEYHIREVVQEASKFMRHSKRTCLGTQDINNALRMMGTEQLFGFSSKEPLRFQKKSETTGLYVVDDPIVSLDEVINQTLPPVPKEPHLSAHWMAIEGVVPAKSTALEQGSSTADVKQNPSVGGIPEESSATATSAVDPDPAEHVLTKELQLYYDSVTDAIMLGTVAQQDAAVASLGVDAGLQELVPYFSLFISDKVTHNLRNLELLLALMRAVFSLLTNPELYLDPYIHQLMPAVLTCVVGKRLCADPVENHWKLRDYAASLVALACRKFGAAYTNLQPRITKTLLNAFVSPSRPLTTHYGAAVALSALGPHTIHTLLLPNLKTYMRRLEPELTSTLSPLRRSEASKCYGALLMAAGTYLSRYWMVFSPPPVDGPRASGGAQPPDVGAGGSSVVTEGEASVVAAEGQKRGRPQSIMENYALPSKKSKQVPMDTDQGAPAATAPGSLDAAQRAASSLEPQSGTPADAPVSSLTAAADVLLPAHAIAYSELFEIFGDKLSPFLPTNQNQLASPLMI
eukprot:SAG11_NODE_1143_length_5699_cov_9.955000_1_plen_562_part_00